MPGVTIEKPKTPEDNLPVHIKKSDVAISAEPSFKNAAGEPKRALVDADQHAQVDVLSMPSVPVEPSFKDSGGVPKRALVDAEQHAQVDVLTSALPSGAATESTLAGRLSESQFNAKMDVDLSTRASRKPKTPSTIVDVSSIGAGGSTTSSMLTIQYDAILALTIRVTYNASATAGIRCDVFTSTDVVNWDTDTYAVFSPSFAAGATRQKTVLIDPTARYIRVTVVNLDGTYATGAVVLVAVLGV